MLLRTLPRTFMTVFDDMMQYQQTEHQCVTPEQTFSVPFSISFPTKQKITTRSVCSHSHQYMWHYLMTSLQTFLWCDDKRPTLSGSHWWYVIMLLCYTTVFTLYHLHIFGGRLQRHSVILLCLSVDWLLLFLGIPKIILLFNILNIFDYLQRLNFDYLDDSTKYSPLSLTQRSQHSINCVLQRWKLEGVILYSPLSVASRIFSLV